MFAHCVYFWLKTDLTEAQRRTFAAGLDSLTTCTSVVNGYVGVPADTDRPMIDRSYSYALVVVFKDSEGHDLYQSDPIHDRFRDECSGLWQKVVIYDFVG